MGAAKKFEEFFLKKEESLNEKQEIQTYIKKITTLIEQTPESQKKAADIISRMIHSK